MYNLINKKSQLHYSPEVTRTGKNQHTDNLLAERYLHSLVGPSKKVGGGNAVGHPHQTYSNCYCFCCLLL